MIVWHLTKSGMDRLFTTEEAARKCAEDQLAEWERDFGDDPDTEAMRDDAEWTWQPDPGLPEMLRDRVPQDKYVLCLVYGVENKSYFRIQKREVEP